MEPLSALNLIEKFEENMFRMYESWSRAFAATPKAVALFEKLKRDEITHRQLVQLQRKIVMESGGFVGQNINIDVIVMNKTIDIVRDSTNKPPRDFKRALEIAYTLESSAAEQYAFTALKEISGDIKKLLVTHSDRFGQHYSLVLDAIRRERLSPISPEHEKLVQLRVPYSSMVTIRDNVTVSGCNISKGGMLVTTDEPLKVGQKLPITLPLPEGPIKVQAVVRNAQGDKNVGLEFSGLSAEQTVGITRYIDRVMSGEQVEIPTVAPEPVSKAPAGTSPATATKAPPKKKPEASTKTTPRPAPVTKPKPPSERVIIVNNSVFSNSDIQMFVSGLEDAGFGVLETTNPTDVLDALADEVTDRAVLLAAETINDDGFPLLGAIKRNPAYANLPLLVLSTSYDKKFINRVLAYGASFSHKMSLTPEKLVDFLGKPGG